MQRKMTKTSTRLAENRWACWPSSNFGDSGRLEIFAASVDWSQKEDLPLPLAGIQEWEWQSMQILQQLPSKGLSDSVSCTCSAEHHKQLRYTYSEATAVLLRSQCYFMNFFYLVNVDDSWCAYPAQAQTCENRQTCISLLLKVQCSFWYGIQRNLERGWQSFSAFVRVIFETGRNITRGSNKAGNSPKNLLPVIRKVRQLLQSRLVLQIYEVLQMIIYIFCS